jgi:glutathione synthase/RimK-type ligase-like ATP-grasp enzyme
MPAKKTQTSPLPIIGPKTLVNFVDFAVNSVPAKVDTGAATSSVWASQITEHSATLSFVLFSPDSPHYTGETIKTADYKVRKIKNSFGDSEFRYQVIFRIKLEDKVVKINATLANREKNRFPILIGARTLKGKFLVDVSQSPDDGQTNARKRLLVLVHKGNDELRAGLKKVQKLLPANLVMDIVRYDELRIEIFGGKLHIQAKRRNLADYKLVYFYTRVANEQVAAIVAAQAKKQGITFFDRAAERLYQNGKLHQLAALAGNNVAVPDSIFVHNALWPKTYDLVVERLGTPFIFKDNAGRKGRHNHLVKTKAAFLDIVSEAKNDGRMMIAQRFIPNKGYYRLLVLGDEVPFVSYREIDLNVSHFFKKENGFVAKLIRPETLPLELLELATSAADSLEINVAGVDMLQDEQSGMWYCLEVNSSPQLINGSLVDEKLAALAGYLKKEADLSL